jgi:hypothetical protein
MSYILLGILIQVLFLLAKKLHQIHLKLRMICKNMIKRSKKVVLADLYLIKIHLLILKLFVGKEISSWVMKLLH